MLGFILSSVMPPLPFLCTAEPTCCLLTWCLSLSLCKCSRRSDQSVQRTCFILVYPKQSLVWLPPWTWPVLWTHKGPVLFFPKLCIQLTTDKFKYYFWGTNLKKNEIKFWDCSATIRYRIGVLRQRHSLGVHSTFHHCHFLLLQRNEG